MFTDDIGEEKGILDQATIARNQRSWLQALRNKEYKQLRGILRTEMGFDVWGLACEISGTGEWDGNTYMTDHPSELDQFVPQDVLEAFGFDPFDEGDAEFIAGITRKNDGGIPFHELADEIETYLATKD